MGHYTRLATLAFRVFGFLILFYAVPIVLFSLVTVVTARTPAEQPPRTTVLAWAVYALAGGLLLTFARPLGRIAARGLEEATITPPAI